MLGYSILAAGFEPGDAQDWRDHPRLAAHAVSTGTLADAAVYGADHDVVVLDLIGRDPLPDSLRRLRSAAPSVGIVAVVDPGQHDAALADGAHEVLSSVHGAGDLDEAIRRAVTRSQAGLRSAPLTVDSVFGRVPAPMFRTLLTGEIIQANQPLAELLGFEEATDLAGMDAADFYVNADVRRRYMDRLQQTGDIERAEMQLRRRDGTTVWVADMSYVVEDGFGRPLYTEGVILDVSDLMRERRRSSTAEQVHEWMFHQSPVPLWELDYSTVAAAIHELGGPEDLDERLAGDPIALQALTHGVQLRYVNQAALELIGVEDRDELDDLAAGSFVLGESNDLAIAQLRAIAAGERQLSMRVIGHDPIGGPLHARVLWVAGDFPDLPAYSRVVVAVMDETVAEQHRRGLERLVESKDAFISSVAHHLRTPLTAVLGFGSELHDHPDRFTDFETKGMLGELVAAAQAATNIVEDMAVAARTELDTLVFQRTTIEIAPIVAEVVETLAPCAKVIGTAASALADAARTRQIIRALVSNAVRHGGPTIEVATTLVDGTVVVEVIDDGPGVDPDEAASIFEAYVSGEDGETMPSPIGLGLHVARRLALHMSGDLEYLAGDRTVFRLSLPASG